MKPTPPKMSFRNAGKMVKTASTMKTKTSPSMTKPNMSSSKKLSFKTAGKMAMMTKPYPTRSGINFNVNRNVLSFTLHSRNGRSALLQKSSLRRGSFNRSKTITPSTVIKPPPRGNNRIGGNPPVTTRVNNRIGGTARVNNGTGGNSNVPPRVNNKIDGNQTPPGSVFESKKNKGVNNKNGRPKLNNGYNGNNNNNTPVPPPKKSMFSSVFGSKKNKGVNNKNGRPKLNNGYNGNNTPVAPPKKSMFGSLFGSKIPKHEPLINNSQRTRKILRGKAKRRQESVLKTMKSKEMQRYLTSLKTNRNSWTDENIVFVKNLKNTIANLNNI